MSYIFYNPNPLGKLTSGDCTVRAISKAMGWSWDKTYAALAVYGMKLCEMPSANQVWGAFLSENGFQEYLLTRSCKKCYTVYDFCNDLFEEGIEVQDDEYSLGGYSQRRMPIYYNNNGNSYRSNRSYGGYSRRGRTGYSRDDGKQHMIHKLEELMNEAQTTEDKDAISRLIDQMEK